MNKLFAFFTLAAGLSMAAATNAAQPIVNGNYLKIYRSPWYMVKDLFITQPQNEAAKLHTTLRGCIKSAFYGAGTIAAFLGIHNWILKPYITAKEDEQPEERQPRTAIERWAHAPIKDQVLAYTPAGGLITVAGIGYKLYERVHGGRKNTHLEQLKMVETVLDRWDEVRYCFPEPLKPIFDTLHDLRKTEAPHYAVNAERALEIIKSEVALHAN